MPDMVTYHVVGPRAIQTDEGIRAAIDAAVMAGLDGVSVNCSQCLHFIGSSLILVLAPLGSNDQIDFPAIPDLITPSVVDYAHRQGLVVAVWKIGSVAVSDTPESWVHMERAGVVSRSFVLRPAASLLTRRIQLYLPLTHRMCSPQTSHSRPCSTGLAGWRYHASELLFCWGP